MAVRWIAFVLISVWLIIVLSIALIFTHFFTKTGVIISSVVIACTAWFFFEKYSSFHEEIAEFRAFILTHVRGRCAVLLITASLIGLIQLTRAIIIPPLSWDSLTYHMTLAGLWVQNGGYTRLLIPDAWDCYSHFPSNGEVFFSWLMLPFQSDLIANLGNFPFLMLGALAVYGLARELEIDRETSLLAAIMVSLSPPLFVYIITQYVEVQYFAEELCGVFFLSRYAKNGRLRDGIMAFVALGLAAGTKVTTLQLLLLSVVAIVGLSLWKRANRKALLYCGIFIAAITASVPWYVRNWLETGSPLYPFSLSIGGMKIFQGSQYMYAMISSLEKNLGQGIHASILYWTKVSSFDFHPLNFGPLFLPVIIGGIAGVLLGLGSRNRITWLIIGIICCSEFAQFMSKGMMPARLRWVELSQRFLMLFFALMVISGLYALTKTRRGKEPIVIILACFAVLYFLIINAYNVVRLLVIAKSEHFILTGAIFVIFIFSVYCFMLPDRIAKPKTLLIGMAVVLTMFLPFTQFCRDRMRYFWFLNTKDQGYIPGNVMLIHGWEFVDNPSKPATIAVTAGWEGIGHNWFLYPLMGRHLQNRLVYISPARSEEIPSYVPDLDTFKKAEASVWIDRVRNAGVDMVFVIMPAPPELTWIIEDNPSIFKLLQKSEGYRIYEFIR